MKPLFFAVLLFIAPAYCFSLDLWRHPEAADINALVFDVRFASISFLSGFLMPSAEAGIYYLWELLKTEGFISLPLKTSIFIAFKH
jgi:hypothetical protein